MARCREFVDSHCSDCGKCEEKGLDVPGREDRANEAMPITVHRHRKKKLLCSRCKKTSSVYSVTVGHCEALLCDQCAWDIGIRLMGESHERLHNGG